MTGPSRSTPLPYAPPPALVSDPGWAADVDGPLLCGSAHHVSLASRLLCHTLPLHGHVGLCGHSPYYPWNGRDSANRARPTIPALDHGSYHKDDGPVSPYSIKESPSAEVAWPHGVTGVFFCLTNLICSDTFNRALWWRTCIS